MRFGVMAAGGVGAYFGGLLARAGEDVRFIARGAHLEAIRREGLRVEAVVPEGGFAVKAPFATDDPAGAGVCDVVLFCVKTTANEAAIPAIAPMMGPDSVVISLQNGVDNEDRLAARYGRERVMGGAAYIFTSVAGPGLIRQIGGPRRLVFGELGGGASPRGERILAVLKNAQVNAELSADIEAELWTKFIFICGVSGMTALTRSPLGEIMAYEGTRWMMRGVMREVCEVGRARGVRLPQGADEDRFRFLGEQNPASKGSLCHDLEAGRRLEIDALCGALSRLGREAGVATPLNDFIYHTLKLADLQIAGEVKLKA
ncbi:MAG: 2-dehydropantoate 2-reductase [Candidatus Tectomicrobia bacterium]|uniref:2-dehydropantoate 2-reductase n=1 Tax=Tectimicrobiota bacterium TaxID=2528274 RepID=A0A932MQ54_UNCTE|nr:2-dehydropantoate 2-reductase [Candidatus Tectomicrobia bacterium]